MKTPLIFFLIIIPSLMVYGQIDIDSLSRESPYGPFTTQYFQEWQIKYNDTTYQRLDTLPNYFQRFDRVWMNDHRYQNLGNLGTALYPIYPQAPQIIGNTSGYHGYDLFFSTPENIKYYDTKSPYSSVFLVLGGERRSRVDVSYSRNISEQWNMGFDITSINADKQINAARKGDQNAVSWNYDFYTSYKSKDKKYHVLANVSRIKHRVFEIGGIVPPEIDSNSDLFGYNNNAKIWLRNAESSQLKVNTHLYQQYKLNDGFQLYHVFNRYSELNKFENSNLSSEADYFDQILIDDGETADSTRLKTLENEFGVKGDFDNLFYSFYVKMKTLKLNYKYLPNPERDNENYGGSYIRYRLTDSVNISFNGEALSGGEFKLGAQYDSKWLKLSFQSSKYRPGFLVTDYFGNHGEWHNNFNSIKSQVFKGSIHARFGPVYLSPNLSFATLNDYVYFNESKRPEQAENDITVLSPGFDFHLRFFKILNLEGKIIYTQLAGGSSDKMRIPEINTSGRFYIEDMLFKDVMWAQIGFDLHWQSAYFANDYDPATQQFFLQNEFEVPSYLLADLFISFKVKRFRWFLKMTNVLQNLEAEGYFTTPYYTGQPRTFDLGINWMFFD